ncbi:hypothetical protein MASR1M65_32960 [Saprospiraceae bacterium]
MINATSLELSMTSTNVTCNGAANGQATAIPSGGTPLILMLGQMERIHRQLLI